MNTYPTTFKFLALTAFALFAGLAGADTLHVTFEPRQIYQLSSKTENARTTCQMCQGTILYERTWKRNHDDGSWIETTKEHPTHCRKCKGKVRELDKYRAEEARLDLKLAKKDLKARINAKKELLRN